MDILYPDSINFLAFGGDLGNNMFFLVSGFTLLSSIDRSGKGIAAFWSWLKKRYLRLLPMVLFMELLTVLFSTIINSTGISLTYLFSVFIFPTEFWFTGAIIIFYPLLYLIRKLDNRFLVGCIIIICLVLHYIFDGIIVERYLFGFISIVLGACIRSFSDKNPGKVMRPGLMLPYLLFIILSAALFSMLKFVRRADEAAFAGLPHLLAGVAAVLLSVALLLFLYYNEKGLSSFL
ncbi:MAG: hypothetical protein K6G03_02945, partial [Lachnospiraceae bacterium]|nr:hypothetical protein [Lachnospiraceae bacterium]